MSSGETVVTNENMDPQAFRHALGHFATGVTIVTTCSSSGEKIGVTANSFNSVSMDPPLVLWSLDKRAHSLAAYEDAEHFVVNILAADQVSLSNRFATRGSVDKFQGVACTEGVGGAPVLAGCAAYFQCRKSFTYEGGDHLILVGEVVNVEATGRSGLVVHEGSYAVSQPHPVIDVTQANQEGTQEFVGEYLDYLLTQTAESFRSQFMIVLDEAGVHQLEWRVLCCLSENNEGMTFERLRDMVLVEKNDFSRLLRSMQDKSWITSGEDFEGEACYWVVKQGLEKIIPLIAAARAHEADALGEFSAEEARQFKDNLKRLRAWVDSEKYIPAHLVPQESTDT
jgi:flavin reductase (DIM6/NTAB) family NADH-FMN oxidoreductase RutF/DNA-binding MarR family transcriptional regulator